MATRRRVINWQGQEVKKTSIEPITLLKSTQKPAPRAFPGDSSQSFDVRLTDAEREFLGSVGTAFFATESFTLFATYIA